MAKKPPFAKGRAQCIFCGSFGPMSREHIWADWISDYIPRTFDKTKHAGSSSYSVPGLIDQWQQFLERSERRGDPLSQKLKIACQKCNNEWMSRIQTRVMPILLPHIKGEWPELTPDGQEVLSAWAAMFTAVFEWKHRPTVAVTPAQRGELRLTERTPSNWMTWVGRYEGKLWRSTVNHFGLRPLPIRMKASAHSQAPTKREIEAIINANSTSQAQSTAFTIGNLFLMTYSWSHNVQPDIDPSVFALNHRLHAIWPTSGTALVMPAHTFDDYEADIVSHSLVPVALRPFVRPAWMA